jgi:hypothetical protein
VLFHGYSERPEFVDGVASTVSINCVGLFKRLRRTLLSSQKDFDGIAHTTVVQDILAIAGFITAADVADQYGETYNSDFPEQEVYIYNDGVNDVLPASGAGSEPAWRPRDGVTAEDFLQQVIEWSGWILFESGGAVYYCPNDYKILQSLLGITSIPTIYQTNTTLVGGIVGQTTPNCDVSMIAALSVSQAMEELVSDDVWVIGMDDNGKPLIAHYEATALLSDRTQTYFVGARWPYILQNASLCTQAAVNAVCARLAAKLTVPTRSVEFELPDYRMELAIGCPCYLEGYGACGIITAIDGDFAERGGNTSDRHRRTKYVAELVG